MTSTYAEIYSILLGLIEEYNYVKMTEDDFNEIMSEKAHNVFGDPLFRSLFSSFAVDDEIQKITWTLEHSVDDYYDKFFVNKAIALGMLVQWLTQKMNTEKTIDYFIGTSRESFKSQATHLATMESHVASAQRDYERHIKAHGYWNSDYYS